MIRIRNPHYLASTSGRCRRAVGFAFGCGLACNIKGFFSTLLCKKSTGKVKPKDNTDNYEDDKDNGINETPTGQQAFEMIVLPIYPNTPEPTPLPTGCSSSKAAAEVPQCYLEAIANKSSGYENTITIAVNPDKTYTEIPIKAAPNGDFYYVQNGIEYWKITGKYTIARKPDGTWMSFDFASGKWCRFQPKQLSLAVEKQIVCNSTELITLKTNGKPPFSYIVRNGGGEIIEQSNLPQFTFNELTVGQKGFSVRDANGCVSKEIIENIERDNGLSLSVSALKECNNTVELFAQCGTPPYLYSIDGINFQSSNRFSGLQNYLILNNLESHTFTLYLIDASSKSVQKSLKVDKVETMVKLKTKNIRFGNKPSFSQMSLNEYNSLDRFFRNGYTIVKRFEKNGLFIASTRQFGCKPGSIVFSFPYSKFPLDLTLTSSNGTVITKQITSENYTLTDLPNGKYSISGKDADGCDLEIADQEFNEVEIQSNFFEISTEIQNRTCASNQQNLRLTIKNTPSDGIPKVKQYKIYINEGLVQEFRSSKEIEIRTLSIGSGENTIKVEESDEGCLLTKTINVPAVQPLSATVRSFPACNGDLAVPITLYVTPVGGEQPFTYSLQSAQKTISGNANIIPDLPNVTYEGTITDKAGCQATFNYTPTPPPNVTVSVTEPSCGANGSLNLELSGGTAPYQYSFDNGTTWQANSIKDGLCEGNYGPFKAKDSKGCEASSAAVTLTSPDVLELKPAEGPPPAIAGARTTQTDDDDYITLTYQGKTVREKIGVEWEYAGDGTSDIIVDGTHYTPLFVDCNKEFYGFYKKDCDALDCTPDEFVNVKCEAQNTIGYQYNGKEACKECFSCELSPISDSKWLENFPLPFVYQTDGHYGTVYLIAEMLGIPDAKKLAYYAEYPDNIINENTQRAELRTTWGNPDFQAKYHALTNGFHGEEEFLTAFALLNLPTSTETELKLYGQMLHRYGDTYAHTRLEDRKLTDVDMQRMYGEHAHPGSGGVEYIMWKLGGTAEHQIVDGKEISEAPDMIKNDPERYLKYVTNLAEILSLKYFQKVKPINLNVFRKMAFYARGADVSLMGIIHYEIAKFQGKSTFTLPYPVLAEAQFDDAVFHKILGTFKAVPDERRNYEKWITQTEAYIVSDGKRPILSRETEDIPCGIDGASYNSSLYSATFNW